MGIGSVEPTHWSTSFSRYTYIWFPPMHLYVYSASVVYMVMGIGSVEPPQLVHVFFKVL